MIGKIFINGTIAAPDYPDSETSLLDVITQVQQLKATHGNSLSGIKVLINSPGGSVDEGNNIYDFLVSVNSELPIIIESNGEVSSIASKIWFASSVRRIRKNDVIMIHNAWAQAIGDADTLEDQADQLREIEKDMVSFYAGFTNINKEGIKALMDNETIINAEEAMKLGFATEIIEPVQALALKINTNQKSKTMSYDKLKAFMASLKPDAKSLSLIGENDAEYFVDVETLDEAVGMQLQIVGEDGNTPAGEGSFTMNDGLIVVTDADSNIVSIDAGESPDELAKRLQKENVELSEAVDGSKTKIEGLEKSVTELTEKLSKFTSKEFEDKMNELNEELEAAEKVKTEAMALKNELKEIKTNFNVPLNKSFKKIEPKTEDDRSVEARERMKTNKKRSSGIKILN